METSTFLLVCVLVTCSVWTVQGKCYQVSIDDQEQVEMEVSAEARKLPGVCWACKWAINKVKKWARSNATVAMLTKKLHVVCSQIGLLKSKCSKFVNAHLGELVEELTTSDDTRTICVNVGACKPKEWEDLLFHPDDEEQSTEMNKYP
ncbi:uncharacterized protein LOC131988574 [Centropristis striata]|uniref:NK-lysin n=1 Tax=Centropristis striata TaxID=184440 RepID=A0A8A4ZRQ6_CENSR|nr:uncharacterized protein LOC131988574 [Centropristis striata]QTE34339.1 NK-lysin [Centropristis striata]